MVSEDTVWWNLVPIVFCSDVMSESDHGLQAATAFTRRAGHGGPLNGRLAMYMRLTASYTKLAEVTEQHAGMP